MDVIPEFREAKYPGHELFAGMAPPLGPVPVMARLRHPLAKAASIGFANLANDQFHMI